MRHIIATLLVAFGLSGAAVLASGPAQADPGDPGDPRIAPGYYVIQYSGAIYLVGEYGDQTYVRGDQWAAAGYPTPTPIRTATFHRTSWSSAIVAVTAFRADRADLSEPANLVRDVLTFEQWRGLGSPMPQVIPLHEESFVYDYWDKPRGEIFVRDLTGVHRFSFAEWSAAGSPQPYGRTEGYYKLHWDTSGAILRVDGIPFSDNPRAQLETYVSWRGLDFPTPSLVQKLPGTSDFYLYPDGSIRYEARGYGKHLTYGEWQAAGSPVPKPIS